MDLEPVYNIWGLSSILVSFFLVWIFQFHEKFSEPQKPWARRSHRHLATASVNYYHLYFRVSHSNSTPESYVYRQAWHCNTNSLPLNRFYRWILKILSCLLPIPIRLSSLHSYPIHSNFISFFFIDTDTDIDRYRYRCMYILYFVLVHVSIPISGIWL